MGRNRGVAKPTIEDRHQEQQANHPDDWSWHFWHAVPLYPYGKRRTLRTEVIKETIWTFDQIQGFFYVVVPIRMTVVKLETGGLLVYAPVAPTPECTRLVNELVAVHGDVKYIILPTISGVEHKVFVGPFARRFPKAQVFVAPNQWSFPLNLPLSWLGLPTDRTHVLPDDSAQTPFTNTFDYAILGPIALGPGRFEEVAFFHKRSRTLLVTDAVLAIPEEPPAIVQLDPYPLLFHAKDSAMDAIEDNRDNRRKGWQRIALFTFYFQPSVLNVVKLWQTIRCAFNAPDHSKKAYFGLFPFQWQDGWEASFEALQSNGQFFVAPILQTLILNRAPQETLAWADKVATWDFCRLIPCHFDAPLDATPQQFRQAFAFLEPNPSTLDELSDSNCQALRKADVKLLREIGASLSKIGIVPPPQR